MVWSHFDRSRGANSKSCLHNGRNTGESRDTTILDRSKLGKHFSITEIVKNIEVH